MAPLNAYAQVIFCAPAPRIRRPTPALAARTRRPMPKTRYPLQSPGRDTRTGLEPEFRQTTKLRPQVEKHGSIYDDQCKGGVNERSRSSNADTRETPAERSQSWRAARPDASPDAYASRR